MEIVKDSFRNLDDLITIDEDTMQPKLGESPLDKF